jgi:serine protease Do
MLMWLAAVAAAAGQEMPPEAATHYETARQALAANDTDKALEAATAGIGLAPQSFQLHFLRGHIHLARKDYGPAEADFTKAITLRPDLPELYTLRARALQGQNRPAEALKDLDRALSLDPDYRDALFSRAFVYVQLGREDAARKDLARAQALGVRFPEEFRRALERAGKEPLAPITVRGRPAEEPSSPLTLIRIAPTPAPPPLQDLSRPPAAEPAPPATPPALSSAPDLVTLLKNLLPAVVTILGYNEAGKFSSFGSGFFIDNQGTLITNYHVIRRMTHAKVKFHDGRIHPLDKVLAVDKNGDLAMCRVDLPGGPPRFLTVSRQVPEVGERVLAIGSPYLLEHTVSEGIVSAVRTDSPVGQAIQMTAPISPGSSGGPVINMKGEVVGVSSFYRKGGQNLNFAIPGPRVLALKPGPGAPLAQFYSPPEVEKARKSYEEGRRLYAARNYQEALKAFRETVKLNPQHAGAFNYLGLTYKHLGLYDEAAKAYVQAIKLEPQNSVFLFNLGMLMYAAGSYAHAATAFEKAVQLKPEDADSHFMLARTYAKQGNQAGFTREYHILQKLEPKLAQALSGLSSR